MRPGPLRRGILPGKSGGGTPAIARVPVRPDHRRTSSNGKARTGSVLDPSELRLDERRDRIALCVTARLSAFQSLAALLGACASEPLQPPPSGAQVFATHCSACHGVLGEGDGPQAAGLGTRVPNLRTLSRRNDGAFPAEFVASLIDGRAMPEAHIRRDMPVWGDVFEATAEIVPGAESPQLRVDALVVYLRELQLP